MGIFDGVLLLSDFDGTLTDSNGNIPSNNIDAIKYFISEGGLFSVSTGRTKVGFHRYSAEIINAPVLLGNGAMAYDYTTESIAFTNSISDDALDTLKAISSLKPYASIELYSVDHKTYVFNPNAASIKHFADLQINDYTVIDTLEAVNFPLVKVMLSVGENTYDMQKFLSEKLPSFIKYIPCSGAMVEILAVNAGKGNALLQLSEYLKTDKNNVYAVGDGSNDTDMLETAKIGFVPENGDEYAKKSGDIIVCSSNNGAVADVIKYLHNIYVKT